MNKYSGLSKKGECMTLESIVKQKLANRFNIKGLKNVSFPYDEVERYEARGYFWVEQHETPLVIEYPADWREAFKEQWLSKWLEIRRSKCSITIRTLFPNIVSDKKGSLPYKVYRFIPEAIYRDNKFIFSTEWCINYGDLVSKRTLQKQEFGVVLSISKIRSNDDIDDYIETLTQNMEMLTQEFDDSLTELAQSKKHRLKFPADWQQAFKERWFPEWLLDRYPVRLTEIDLNDMAIDYENPLPDQDFVYMVWSVNYDE